MYIESILVNTTRASTACISSLASAAANALSGGELYESRHRLRRAKERRSSLRRELLHARSSTAELQSDNHNLRTTASGDRIRQETENFHSLLSSIRRRNAATS